MESSSKTIFLNPPKGFRLLPTDLILLALGVLLPVLFQEKLYGISYLFSVVIFHFFLFCNVFRTRALYEIVWAVIFIIHFFYRFSPEGVDWLGLLIYQTPFTLGVVVMEIFTGTYRGIFYELVERGEREK